MSLLKAREIREMTTKERNERLEELRTDLMHQRGVAAMGGAPPSPGMIRNIRTAIARLETVIQEEEN